MNFFKRKKHHLYIKWLLIIVAIFLTLAIIFLVSLLSYESIYKNKIYPGIYLGENSLGGLTRENAHKFLNESIDKFNRDGISFSYDQHKTIFYPLVKSVEGDLSYQIINFNTDKTIEDAFSICRTNNLLTDTLCKFNLLLDNKLIEISYIANKTKIIEFFNDNFSIYESPAIDADLNIKIIKNNYVVDVTDEKYGQIFEIDKAFNQLSEQIKTLDNSRITLSAIIENPKIYKNEVLNAEAQTLKILKNTPLELKFENNNWTLDDKTIVEWVKLKKDSNVFVGIDFEKVSSYLQDYISSDINKDPINAKFEIKNGRVIEFQASKDGQELDIGESAKKIELALLKNQSKEVELAVKEIKSKISAEDVNDLGIREIIGTGSSTFTGSPANRRHNISVGADSINGLLIKPGEEFSLIQALGEINGESGYKTELVIKDNKTIPEYGGGLCQIGTTLFRTVVQSGLPVTMRRNHSYRVSYYEPAGTDATIYDPWPDFRFKNDTKNHILIQTHIIGDKLIFDFWGTNDGRVAENTYPIVYNIVKPAPTKIIETLDLEPGIKKCTEHAHNGADAYFDYTVTYPDGDVKEERFKSHYSPWQEVCLLGVEQLSEDKENAEVIDNEVENSSSSKITLE